MQPFSYYTFPFPADFRKTHDGMDFAIGKLKDVLWTWMIGGYWDKNTSPSELARMSVNFDLLIGEAVVSLTMTMRDLKRIAAPIEDAGDKEGHLLHAASLSLEGSVLQLTKQVAVLRAAIRGQGDGDDPEKGPWPVDHLTLKASVRKIEADYEVVFDTLVMAIRQRVRREVALFDCNAQE